MNVVSYIATYLILFLLNYETKCKYSYINKQEGKIKIVKTALDVQLSALLKRNFPYTSFGGISRVSILSSSCEWLFLKDCTPKLLYQRPRSDLRSEYI